MNEHAPKLSPSGRTLLRRMSDPASGVSPGPLNVSDWVSELPAVMDAARCHGVLPIVWRRLRAEPWAVGHASLMEDVKTKVAALAGQSLLLRRHGNTIGSAFRKAELRHTVVKGPVFARRLYATPADRPFTDIDFLVHPDDIDDASGIMRELGYDLREAPGRDSSAHREFKWTPAEDTSLLIEIHTNLVHVPRLQNAVTLDYDGLLECGRGDPEAPVALLAVACIHAAVGHHFNRLLLLVDALQAVRGLNALDPDIARAAEILKAEIAFATTLDLAGRLFGEPRAKAAAAALSGAPGRMVARLAVTCNAALRAQEKTVRRRAWRRHLFRGLLRLPRLRKATA